MPPTVHYSLHPLYTVDIEVCGSLITPKQLVLIEAHRACVRPRPSLVATFMAAFTPRYNLPSCTAERYQACATTPFGTLPQCGATWTKRHIPLDPVTKQVHLHINMQSFSGREPSFQIAGTGQVTLEFQLVVLVYWKDTQLMNPNATCSELYLPLLQSWPYTSARPPQFIYSSGWEGLARVGVGSMVLEYNPLRIHQPGFDNEYAMYPFDEHELKFGLSALTSQLDSKANETFREPPEKWPWSPGGLWESGGTYRCTGESLCAPSCSTEGFKVYRDTADKGAVQGSINDPQVRALFMRANDEWTVARNASMRSWQASALGPLCGISVPIARDWHYPFFQSFAMYMLVALVRRRPFNPMQLLTPSLTQPCAPSLAVRNQHLDPRRLATSNARRANGGADRLLD